MIIQYHSILQTSSNIPLFYLKDLVLDLWHLLRAHNGENLAVGVDALHSCLLLDRSNTYCHVPKQSERSGSISQGYLPESCNTMERSDMQTRLSNAIITCCLGSNVVCVNGCRIFQMLRKYSIAVWICLAFLCF